jgi:hypothetical protein
MPYITKQDRINLDAGGSAQTAGELNYEFTKLIVDYVSRNNNYQGMNDIIGALEGAKLEFYARWVRPYEDYKIAVNGDVYPTGES